MWKECLFWLYLLTISLELEFERFFVNLLRKQKGDCYGFNSELQDLITILFFRYLDSIKKLKILKN